MIRQYRLKAGKMSFILGYKKIILQKDKMVLTIIINKSTINLETDDGVSTTGMNRLRRIQREDDYDVII